MRAKGAMMLLLWVLQLLLLILHHFSRLFLWWNWPISCSGIAVTFPPNFLCSLICWANEKSWKFFHSFFRKKRGHHFHLYCWLWPICGAKTCQSLLISKHNECHQESSTLMTNGYPYLPKNIEMLSQCIKHFLHCLYILAISATVKTLQKMENHGPNLISALQK